jgi:aspartate ammonia-lyase
MKTTPAGKTRLERDLLGERRVPAGAYCGIQTERAAALFDIEALSLSPRKEKIVKKG